MAIDLTVTQPSIRTGSDFRRWRKSLNLTQKEAAMSLGVTPRTIVTWEDENRVLSRMIGLACRFLDERPWELVRFTPTVVVNAPADAPTNQPAL